MRSLLTPSELRLALLFLGLAVLGFLVRQVRDAPSIEAWLEKPPIAVDTEPHGRDRGWGRSRVSKEGPTSGPRSSMSPEGVSKDSLAHAHPPKGPSPGSVPGRATPPASQDPADNKINPNHASLDELLALPGIGPTLAGRILEERERGRFESAVDMLRVKGVGQATLARLAPLLDFSQ